AYLFTFFIALGHFARIFNLPLLALFQLVRILGGFSLLWLIYELAARLIVPIDRRRRMWWLVALSSGLGWLAALLGHSQSADLAIPESNTFYSLIANMHFALAAAIMIAIFIGVLGARKFSGRRVLALSLLSLGLAVIQPFAPFAVYLILGVALFLIWRRDRIFPRTQFSLTFIAGLITAPLLLYIYLATQSDPTLQQWSIQNQTPSPPLIDYVIGYGLLSLLAIPGLRSAWQRRSNWDILLIVWIIVTLPLLYAPIPLQRRLSLGLHIPIALLAAYGIDQLFQPKLLKRLLIATTYLTSFFLIVGFIGNAVKHDPRIYLTSNEVAALNWLQSNAQPNSIILASPELSAFIPAFTDQRVVYGHPYETINAEQRKQQVTEFYGGQLGSALLTADSVAYVIVGPRERALGTIDPNQLPLRLVFNMGDVNVYQVLT
ncbi:MAG TPA: hypothetical protein VFK30_05755, partial [Anaerolineae bacterium]|nr:hypothetical protein [Anaerolineae bacterium]